MKSCMEDNLRKVPLRRVSLAQFPAFPISPAARAPHLLELQYYLPRSQGHGDLRAACRVPSLTVPTAKRQSCFLAVCWNRSGRTDEGASGSGGTTCSVGVTQMTRLESHGNLFKKEIPTHSTLAKPRWVQDALQADPHQDSGSFTFVRRKRKRAI